MTRKQLQKRKLIKAVTLILNLLIALVVITAFTLIYYLVFVDRVTKPIIKGDMSYKIRTEEFADRNVFVVSSQNETTPTKVILYLHGGGYVEEMSPEYWAFFEKLVNDTNTTVIIPDYPLAPKYNYIDVFNMIEPLYKEIIKEVDVNNLILMGDSAGGGMSLALLEKLNEKQEKVPSQTILISPWLDVTMENSKIDEIQDLDTVLNKSVLKLAGTVYAKNDDNVKNYIVSPIYGDLSKIKNVTIFTGTYDILNPDVHVLMEKAQTQNADIKLKEYQQAKHIWLIKNNTDESITNKAYRDLVEKIGGNMLEKN